METIYFASQPVMHLQKAGWKKKANKKIPLMVTNETKENPSQDAFQRQLSVDEVQYKSVLK
jgi:hypothetical protein